MKRSISLRLSAMFGIASLLVFTLIGIGLFAMMERQLFAELRATLETRAKVAEMIVSHATTAARWHITQEKLTDLQPLDGSTRYIVASEDPAFRLGTPIDGEPVGMPIGAFQLVHCVGSSYNVMTRTTVIPTNGVRPELTLIVAATCDRTQKMLRFIALDAGRADRRGHRDRAAAEPRGDALRARAAGAALAGGRRAEPGQPPAAAADRRAAQRAARPRHLVQRRAGPHRAGLRAARVVQRRRRARAAHAVQHPDRPDPGGAQLARSQRGAHAADAAVEPRGVRAAARDRQRHAVPVAQRPRRARHRSQRRLAGRRGVAHARLPRDLAGGGATARRAARATRAPASIPRCSAAR